MDILIVLIICIFGANILTYLLSKIHLPNTISLILFGLFLGVEPLRSAIIESNEAVIAVIGNLGLLALLFQAGLGSSRKMLSEEGRDSFILSLFATFFPLFLGAAVFYLLGYSIITSLIIGVCMSISAEAITIVVLMKLNKLKSKIGSLIIEAGLIDDLIGLLSFLLIGFLVKKQNAGDEVIIIGIFVAFVLGIFLQRIRNLTITKKIETIADHALIPFFFINIGVNFDFSSLAVNPYLVFFLIILAVFGKIIGTMLSKPFLKIRWIQLYLIGWAMNSRGAVELVLALIAYLNGLITIDIYSSLVMMAIVTTMIFPMAVSMILHKNPRVMN